MSRHCPPDHTAPDAHAGLTARLLHRVHPHAYGWAVVRHDTPGGTVVETYDSRSTAITVAQQLNHEARNSG